MSHVVNMGIVVQSLEALKKACEVLGTLEFVQDQTNFKWYGQWMNDYSGQDAAYRQGVDPKEYGKCLHAIRVKGKEGAYEIGVVKNRNGEGFLLVWDNWMGGYGLVEKVGQQGEILFREYTKQQTLLTAEQEMGITQYEEEKQPDGSTVLYLYDYNS